MKCLRVSKFDINAQMPFILTFPISIIVQLKASKFIQFSSSKTKKQYKDAYNWKYQNYGDFESGSGRMHAISSRSFRSTSNVE